MAQSVQHNQEAHQFEIDWEGEAAVLKYRKLPGAVVEYYSTFVPESARGQGLARLLVEAGVTYAQKKNLKIQPTCSYVDKVLTQHDEWHQLIAR